MQKCEKSLGKVADFCHFDCSLRRNCLGAFFLSVMAHPAWELPALLAATTMQPGLGWFFWRFGLEQALGGAPTCLLDRGGLHQLEPFRV